ncbi:XRE family transcriptional regulator [Amycolatopsis nigrescens]|uniref:XRE family transcriptional regulator n=1 Tax=Amycolatopsis nigrescens TaxID=381445 RepID=UPI0003A744AD|nr:XRE family transcriptional regulator [Amycolatopsis nigrescens]
MPNERLRDVLLRNGLKLEDLADATAVDRKTVERWITKGRIPYPRHRHTIAALVREPENYLWPDAVPPERKAEIGGSEVVKIYPHRHSAPYELWSRLIDQAENRLEILVYSATFLTYDPSLIKRLRQKAHQEVKIRIMVGDPGSREVTRRSIEEGIGKTTLAAKVRSALTFYRALADEPGIEIRCHTATLYNSIYRFDDEMLVNTHVYGLMAAHAPLLHLRRLTGGDLFETYAESFGAVWSTAKPPKWP